ncbi:Rabaptin-like family protein [Acanthocheilonema viteae]
MSMENLDVMTDGEVLTSKLSNSGRGDATAPSVLESTIENPRKWVNIMDKDLVSEVNANDASVFIRKETNDPTSDEIATAANKQQNSLEEEVIKRESSFSEAMNEGNKIPDTICEEHVTVTSCEMCHNYELNLTKMQDVERNLKEQLSAAQHLVNRYQNELSGERLYRKEMEMKTTTLCADNEKEVNIAKNENEECAKHLVAVNGRCVKLIQEQRNNIGRLRELLSMMNKDMHNLSNRYLKLLGANRKCSTEMRDQTIELPQDVDQLQFLCLQLREELIETRAAKEHAEVVLRDEIATLEAQRKEDEMEKRRIEDAYTERVNGVSQELGFARSQLDSMKDASSKVEEMNKRMIEYREVIEDLEKQLQSVQKERTDLEMTVALYKQKCAALQQELDTSETVQKDFVKLSQNLQIELEKIRQAEQEVRWQFDEDVHACNQCQSNFSKSRIKLHCYHCGKIFCPVCLSATIPSGPHRRPARVCQVCHTLLSRDSAPFFSHNLEAV